jgi:hypothetical protein
MVSRVFLSPFSGSNIHDENNVGSTPKVAMSLAFTLTASQPIRSTAPVIGSIESIRDLFPMSITAPSNPADGPKTTSSRLTPKFLKTTSFKMSTGIFPSGSFSL